MKSGLIRKIVIGISSVFFLLVLVLAVHIYVVTRPKITDPNTLVMARMDIKQPIQQKDAEKITAWLYRQKGIDHVLCNPQSDILVFTYYPAKADPNSLTAQLQNSLGYRVSRYIPNAEDLKTGCPVGSQSKVYQLYSYLKKNL